MQDSVEECGAVRVVCGQERLGAGGALSLRKGVGGYEGVSRETKWTQSTLGISDRIVPPGDKTRSLPPLVCREGRETHFRGQARAEQKLNLDTGEQARPRPTHTSA